MSSTSIDVAPPTKTTRRLESLDQFRGYTVLGMLLVNFVGGFAVCPRILKHTHDYVSYADLIMPQFLFAVGFAMRLSLRRKIKNEGHAGAIGRMIRRLLGLVLVALVVYTVGPRAESWSQFQQMSIWEIIGEPLKRGWFQTLMHIAITSLWILPVINAGVPARLLWMIGSAALHVGLSQWFNFHWVNTGPNGVDGGPLGFLTWTIPALIGSFAYDMFFFERTEFPAVEPKFTTKRIWSPLLIASILMLSGYAISCGTRLYDAAVPASKYLDNEKLAPDPVIPKESRLKGKQAVSTGLSSYLAEPPFIAPPDSDSRKWNYWMMSQRAGTLSYLVFTAGFSLALFAAFYVVCDVWGLRLGLFHTFGVNALLAYVLHDLVGAAMKPFIPKDSAGWYVIAAVGVFFLINWIFVRHFEKNGIYLRV